MKFIISVYRSPKKAEMYLYMNKPASFDELPDDLKTLFGPPEKVMDMILTEQKKLARVDMKKLRNELAEKGYYLQLPPASENLLHQHRVNQGLDPHS
jgi:uncharacterized protein YcgL (UPF0745 family)